MKVLWFEISTPSRYRSTTKVIGGWQDSLENIVRECKNIELYIAFESEKDTEIKVVDEVTYIPMKAQYSVKERWTSKFTWKICEKKMIENGIRVIEKIRPDIIHVFGHEWPFGLLAAHTNIPLVLHIQGSLIPYNNALYPPGYNGFTLFKSGGLNLKRHWRLLKEYYRGKSRLEMEQRIWKVVSHYMGRTQWDKGLVNVLQPTATYHHVEEALRPSFINPAFTWKYSEQHHLRLFSTGCTSLWKGLDVMLKTANILKNAGVDFEWNVAGYMPNELRKLVEKKEGMSFSENNIKVLGFVTPDIVTDYLCKSSMYVHTAYIENSPNSICEAQILGVPVISTMVGGISSLVRNGIDGELYPANDPWQLANAIIKLAKDKKKSGEYSTCSKEFATHRHSKENILSELLECYISILKK